MCQRCGLKRVKRIGADGRTQAVQPGFQAALGTDVCSDGFHKREDLIPALPFGPRLAQP